MPDAVPGAAQALDQSTQERWWPAPRGELWCGGELQDDSAEGFVCSVPGFDTASPGGIVEVQSLPAHALDDDEVGELHKGDHGKRFIGQALELARS